MDAASRRQMEEDEKLAREMHEQVTCAAVSPARL